MFDIIQTYRTDVPNVYLEVIMNNRINRHRISKIKRTRQLRKRLFLTIIAFLLGAFISIIFLGTSAKAEEKNANITYKYYKSITVKNDDTLWGYALEYSKDSNYQRYVDEVMHINNLMNEDINQGMALVIPYYSEEFRF